MGLVSMLGIMVVVFAVPLFALRWGKEWLIALLPIYLITGNVFAESFLTLFGRMTSLAIPVYAATFLITDILSEHYGKSDAKRAVLVGFMGQILFMAMTWVVLQSPIFAGKAEAFSKVFALLPRLIAGSFIAYLISQFWDVYIFHLIREKTGSSKKTLWIRNNLSTCSSQLLDTVIFLTIAFAGRPEFTIEFILTTWVIKMIVAILDTPYMYLSYKVIGKRRKQ